MVANANKIAAGIDDNNDTRQHMLVIVCTYYHTPASRHHQPINQRPTLRI